MAGSPAPSAGPTAATTWREAWMASPGPRTPRRALALFVKGCCMGAADIVPGVSGGTIALASGIYEDLVAAIRSVGPAAAGELLRLRPRRALALVHLRFLLPLLLGIGLAVVSMARLIHYMLAEHPVETWSLFFGLIAASVVLVARRVERWGAGEALLAVLGLGAGWALVGLIPVQTPETWWFLLLCGALAICAMILPGISGAFILLLLGKYEYVTAAIKDPLAPESLAVIAVFALGAAAGIIAFSRLLHYLLSRWHAPTMAVLTGLVAGVLRKVWPWKEVLATQTVGSRTFVVSEANIAPDGTAGQTALAVGLMLAGAVLILALERLGGRNTTSKKDAYNE